MASRAQNADNVERQLTTDEKLRMVVNKCREVRNNAEDPQEFYDGLEEIERMLREIITH